MEMRDIPNFFTILTIFIPPI